MATASNTNVDNEGSAEQPGCLLIDIPSFFFLEFALFLSFFCNLNVPSLSWIYSGLVLGTDIDLTCTVTANQS